MLFKNILNHFPPPKFLDIPYAGVSIEDSAIRCVLFGKDKGRLFLDKYVEKVLPKGVIVSGQINNKDEVIKVLTEIKKDLNIDYMKVSLPEEKAYLFTAKIPIVGQEEVRGVIESKIEENVPVSPSELVFDYKLIDHRLKGHLDVIVSALPIHLVDLYTEIAEKSGLTLLALEIESQAVARALLPTTKLDGVIIVHFGVEKIALYIVCFGIVHFTSTIPINSYEPKEFDFFMQEVRKLYIYWHTLKENADKPERKITEVVVCGEGLREDIVDYLSQHIDTKVVVGNPWENAFSIEESVPDIHHDDALRYVGAIGLALPSDVLI